MTKVLHNNYVNEFVSVLEFYFSSLLINIKHQLVVVANVSFIFIYELILSIMPRPSRLQPQRMMGYIAGYDV